MASLSSIRLDQRKINDGAWVTVEADGEPFDIRTRGFTPRYRDMLYRLRIEAVRDLNRGRQPGAVMASVDTLPPSVEDQCYGRSLAEECFLDVRGLTHEKDGPEVTAAEFKALLCDPEGCGALVILVMGAAARVTNDRAEEVQTAAGNSQTASAGT
jgi:hypothetical protein